MTDPANPFADLYPFSPTLRATEATWRPATRTALALQHLFLYLRDRGFPLTIRDYEDALQALEAGYGLPTREKLLWLCRTLWARTEDETRLLDLLFRDFPAPTPDEVAALTGRPDPPPDASTGRAGPQPGPDDRPPSRAGGEAEALPMQPQFAGPGQTGLGLPQAQIAPDREETFILTERPIIPLRKLIVIWRRFRRPLRFGPKVELDIEATIAARCRQGLLEAPVLAPARRNLARLTLLIDVSDSMRPWQSFNALLVESLRESRLGRTAIYYTYGLDTDTLFKRESLTGPTPLAGALRDHPGGSLLIFSDAGAAEGVNRRSTVRAAQAFLKTVARTWSPAAWLNPMPAARWPRTPAAKIEKLPQVSMFELTEDGLINAVDVLRGK